MQLWHDIAITRHNKLEVKDTELGIVKLNIVAEYKYMGGWANRNRSTGREVAARSAGVLATLADLKPVLKHPDMDPRGEELQVEMVMYSRHIHNAGTWSTTAVMTVLRSVSGMYSTKDTRWSDQ
jgi:hypothetical protein